ncbi:MAG TPA: NADPH-dependent F420 reductase [Acidimicrobiales bacterium]|nr:NADPH-dependent F420 reductase [Acidimicrobiales bacterium]
MGVLGGTGPAGSGLAARLAANGNEVILGSRSVERAEEVCEGIKQRWPDRTLTLSAGDNLKATSADIVVVATPWDSAAAVVSELCEQLEGKVIVSMANALAKVGDEFQPLISPRGSVAGSVQSRLPNSYVAAAFQHLAARALATLDVELEADVLVCSDHPQATAATIEMANTVPGLRGLDAGPLGNAGSLESMVAILREVNVRYKGSRSSVRLTGVKA